MGILLVEIYVLVLCVMALILLTVDIAQTHKQKKKGKDDER